MEGFILTLIHFFVLRFKKCKEVGMRYHNIDDTSVQIPRELFEVRQRELAQISPPASQRRSITSH